MLNPQVNRGQVSAARRASLVAIMFAVALPIAAASQPSAGANGSVMDPSGLPLPDAVVRLAPVGGGAPIETRTDASGSFEFSSTPAGEYMLSVRVPGFSTTRERVRISGPVTFKLQMQVGTLNETITVTGGPGNAVAQTQRAARPQPAAPKCGATSVGGNLKPPMKLTDVRPRYRQEWLQSGLEGTVLLQARIGIDGRVTAVEVVSPTNQELEDEAIAAVTQWEFSPTYLNCEAVEVRMFVTVSFKAGQ